MIIILLKDLRWRIALIALIAAALYALEPGFHQHDDFSPEAIELGPLGVSATLSYLAGLSMIALLAGFISTDRREGYSRLFFAHPTSPLGYYGLRWGVSYALSFAGAVLFLVVGQIIAWGGILGGWRGLVLPLLSALIYGSLVAFFSVILPRGEAWVVLTLLVVPTFFPQLLSVALAGATPLARQAVLLLLPPHGALQQVWEGVLLESFAWGAIAFAAAYGLLFLIAAGLILKLREWP